MITRLKFGASYLKVVTAHTFRSFKTTCPICYLSSVSKLLCCLWFTKLATRVTIDPFFVYVFIAWGNYRLNLKYCVIIWKTNYKIGSSQHLLHKTVDYISWNHLHLQILYKKRKDANIFRLLCIRFVFLATTINVLWRSKNFVKRILSTYVHKAFTLYLKSFTSIPVPLSNENGVSYIYIYRLLPY